MEVLASAVMNLAQSGPACVKVGEAAARNLIYICSDGVVPLVHSGSADCDGRNLAWLLRTVC